MAQESSGRSHVEWQESALGNGHAVLDKAADLYAVFGVERDADADTLAAAYGRLRGRYHPERNPGDALAAEIVRYLDGAYAVLIDPTRRRAYDADPSNGHANGIPGLMNGAAVDGTSNGRVAVADAPRGVAEPAVSSAVEVAQGEAYGRGGRKSAYASRDLTTGSIPKNLWFLAWPQFIEGLLSVADQMADLFWAGRGFGARAIAGIGVAQNYAQLVMTGRLGIDMGMRAMVSRAVGAGDLALANHVALQAFTLSGGLSLVLVILGVVFTEPLLRILGVSDAVVAEGAAFMRWQFVSSATIAFRMMSGAALQASGDTLTPMKATSITRVVHFALAPFLAFGWWVFPEVGLMGLAMANGVGQLFGAAINFFALFRGTSRLQLTLTGYSVDLPLLWRLTKLGAPASITQMERAISQLLLFYFVTFFGDYAVAAYSLTRRTEMFVNMGSWGIGNSAGTLVGQNLGAGKPERAKAAIVWATGYVAIVKTVLGGLLFAFPVLFISVFNEDPELLPLAVIWLRIQVLGYLAMGMTQVIMQAIQTAGDMIFPMVVTLVCVWGLEVPLSYTLSRWTDLGQYGIAWAVVIGLTVRLAIFIPYFLSGRWTRKALIEDIRGKVGTQWRITD